MTFNLGRAINRFEYQYSRTNGLFGEPIWVGIDKIDIPICIDLNIEKELGNREGTTLKSCKNCKYKLFEKCILYKAKWRKR